MKKQLLLVGCTLLALLPTACIQDETPNAEADIIKCTLPDEILTDKYIDYHEPFNAEAGEQGAYPLNIEVNYGTDLTALAPTFELTPGATIHPASGSEQNFTTPVFYTVTSESGEWQRTYIVNIHYPDEKDIPTTYHFETAKIQDTYYVFYDKEEQYATHTWASGNAGFAIAAKLQGITSPDEYPTTISNDGYNGNCAKLQTRLTGTWGERMGKPIAAGNLFMGTFYLPIAVTNSLEATRFGIPFYQKPTMLTGYFKYIAGEKYYDNGNYTEQEDKFNIYAMFFETTDDVQYLDGHAPAQGLSHPNMVAMAKISEEEIVESTQWRRFEIPFEYTRNIDEEKLRGGKYSVAIVFSSSRDGDEFKGAPGSTLYVDEVELIYE